MKNKIAFIIIALLLNCGTNADYSFNLLGDAFSVWYYKNHPTISTLHNNKYHDMFKRNDFKSNEQYLLDLNRFYFELTQINMQKLNLINKVKYDRVQRTISKLIYLNEIIKEQDWRPSLWKASRMISQLCRCSWHWTTSELEGAFFWRAFGGSIPGRTR